MMRRWNFATATLLTELRVKDWKEEFIMSKAKKRQASYKTLGLEYLDCISMKVKKYGLATNLSFDALYSNVHGRPNAVRRTPDNSTFSVFGVSMYKIPIVCKRFFFKSTQILLDTPSRSTRFNKIRARNLIEFAKILEKRAPPPSLDP